MNPLQLLEAWSERRDREPGLLCEYTADSTRQSARIDVESAVAFGRATVWEKGMCDIEVIDAKDGQQLMYLHIDLATEEALRRGLDEMVRHTLSGYDS